MSVCVYIAMEGSRWRSISIACNSLSSTGLILLSYQVAQMVKNPFAMWKTWVRSLVWGEPLDLFQYSGLKNSMHRGAWQATVHGVTNSQT